jgi:hypothetical protein
MNKWILDTCLFAVGISVSSAATVNIEPVFTASGASFSAMPANRFGMIASPGDKSAVTDLITGPLQTVGPAERSWIGARYMGIHSSDTTFTVLEEGVAAFQLAAPYNRILAGGALATDMAAVIPRSGSWSTVSTVPAGSPLAGASGTATATDLSINIALGGLSLSGSIGYSVEDDTHIRLAPFVLAGGAASHSFSEGWLDPDGSGGYSGLIVSANPASFDSIAYVIHLTGMPDADSDGNPDLTDRASPVWYAPYSIVDDGVVESRWFGSFRLYGSDVIFHDALHWLYCTSQGSWLIAYDFNGIGWLATCSAAYPYVYLYDVPSTDGRITESGWAYVSEGNGDGHTWLFFFGGSRAQSGTYPEYRGWWRF